MGSKIKHVFLDTEVYEAIGYKLDNKEIEVLFDLVKKNEIKVYITDIVEREVANHINEQFNKDKGIIQSAGDLLKRKYKQDGLLEVFDKVEWDSYLNNLKSPFDNYCKKVGIVTITSKDVDYKQIVDDYFNKRPPFINSKKEFPDAISAKELLMYCEVNNIKMYVISNNSSDWEYICNESSGFLHYIRLLPEFLELFPKEEDVKRIKDFIDKNKDDILEYTAREFEETNIDIDNLDGELEDIEVTDTIKFSTNIIKANKGKAQAIVTVDIYFDATAIYHHPDHFHYDYETKEGCFFGDKKRRKINTSILVDVSLEIEYNENAISIVEKKFDESYLSVPIEEY